jgi:hypothetical protein
MDVELKIRLIAEQQHGLITNAQLRGLGLDHKATGRRIAAGVLETIAPRIHRLRGAPAGPLQRAHAAVLDAGLDGALSHASALAMVEVPRFELEPLHVWRRRGRADHEDRLAIQHRTRRLMPNHVVRVHGIPTTTPTRALVDMAALLSPWDTERLYEDLVTLGLTYHALIDRMLCSLSRQGRTGLVVVREINESRGPDYVAAESNLERRAQAILEPEFGEFARQVDVEDEVGWIARVDLQSRRDRRVIVEVQSDRYHRALVDEAADRRRIARLEQAGRIVAEVREHDVWHDRQAALAAVAIAFERARILDRAA